MSTELLVDVLYSYVWVMGALVIFMSLAWLTHISEQNAGLADVGFGLAFAVIAIVVFETGVGWVPRKILLSLMLAAWGIRLGSYLYFDRVHDQMEGDFYRSLREKWGLAAGVLLFLLFHQKGLLAALLAIPFIIAAQNREIFISWFEVIATVAFLASFSCEILADSQLRTFKNRPSKMGQVCNVGLWKYSRHPNYFFTLAVWISFAFVACGSPYGYLGLISPLLLGYLLMRVTGIPRTEAQALRNRGEAYREYQRVTSVLIPWSPQKNGPDLTLADALAFKTRPIKYPEQPRMRSV